MKRALIAGLCLASGVAFADCHVRTNIQLARQPIVAGPTDIQQLVSNDGAGKRCVIRYRVNIDDEWATAEGVGQGATEAEACSRAVDYKNGAILAEVEPGRVTADTQMVCTDLEEIRIRPVRIGEVIWESEVDLHRHPDERKYFKYKATQCRMFTERNVKDRNLYTYQGVICKTDSSNKAKWRVVDKY
jgi:hypothetical protein